MEANRRQQSRALPVGKGERLFRVGARRWFQHQTYCGLVAKRGARASHAIRGSGPRHCALVWLHPSGELPPNARGQERWCWRGARCGACDVSPTSAWPRMRSSAEQNDRAVRRARPSSLLSTTSVVLEGS